MMSGQSALRADAQRNRTKVLLTAKVAFAEDGLSVSLDEIALRAGVGVGTVYRHFPTKKSLLDAVVTERIQTLVDDAKSLRSAPDPAAALFGFIERLVLLSQQRDLVEVLNQSHSDLSPATSRMIANLHREVGQLLKRSQRYCCVRKSVDLHDLMALVSGLMLAAQRITSPLVVARLIDVVCDGLHVPAYTDPL
jgi:AcrR family transcriptional regulator